MIRCTFEDGKTAQLRHVVVDVLLFNAARSEILLVRRSPNLNNGGKLGVIGGYVEPNENCAHAAKREVLEETGYTIVNLELLEILDGPRPKDERQNIAFVYTATALEKVGEPDHESTEQLWLQLSDLPEESAFAFDHYTHIMHYLESAKRGTI